VSERARWIQAGLKSLFLLAIVAAAFFAGWGIVHARTKKAVQEAQDMADAVQRQAEDERKALQQERALWGMSPPVPDEGSPKQGNGSLDVTPP
jgi:hypothetical protein